MSAEIVVTCSDSGHEGKVVNIIKFQRDSDGRWLMGPITLGGSSRGQLWPRPYDQYLIGDTPVDPDGRLDPAEKSAARSRVSVQCDLCGFGFVARGETLYPILDKLADHGVVTIELKDLAARIFKASRGA